MKYKPQLHKAPLFYLSLVRYRCTPSRYKGNAFDLCFIPKAGNSTYGGAKYWSGQPVEQNEAWIYAIFL